jgi:hypothetical protein
MNLYLLNCPCDHNGLNSTAMFWSFARIERLSVALRGHFHGHPLTRRSFTVSLTAFPHVAQQIPGGTLLLRRPGRGIGGSPVHWGNRAENHRFEECQAERTGLGLSLSDSESLTH